MEISTESDGKYYINYKAQSREHPEATAELYDEENGSDLIAKNGIIHRTSLYAPLWQSEDPVQVLFDFCDFPELVTYISEHGIEGQEYRVAKDAELRTALANSNGSLVGCYTVEIGPDGTKTPLSSYNYVDYFTAKTAGGWYGAGVDSVGSKYNDMLILNIGYLGTIAMKTPILIKGKYKVTLQFGYATTQNFMRELTDGSNGGKMKFTFDGAVSIEPTPYSASNPDGTKVIPSSTLGVYKYLLYDELEFDKTASHTLKIVVMDPAASSNSAFRIYLDYLLFEPIL